MKLTLELHDTKYTVETNYNDYTANELKEIFSRILVVSGYDPSVIELQEGGRFEYLKDDEIVVKKEVLENAKRKETD